MSKSVIKKTDAIFIATNHDFQNYTQVKVPPAMSHKKIIAVIGFALLFFTLDLGLRPLITPAIHLLRKLRGILAFFYKLVCNSCKKMERTPKTGQNGLELVV